MKKQKVVRTRPKGKSYYYEPAAFEWLASSLENGWRVAMCNKIGDELEYILEKDDSKESSKKTDRQKSEALKQLAIELERSDSIMPIGMTPLKLADGVRRYSSIGALGSMTIDFNMLAQDVYESGILKEANQDA